MVACSPVSKKPPFVRPSVYTHPRLYALQNEALKNIRTCAYLRNFTVWEIWDRLEKWLERDESEKERKKGREREE